MWQSADQSEARYNSTTSSSLSQLADLAESSSGDVTLSAIPATSEQGGDAKPANPAAPAAVIADAATIVAAFGDGSDGGDQGGVFHFSTAPDVFWFNDDQTSVADQNPIAGGRVSADDQSALVDSFVGSPWDVGSELAFTKALAGLFHDDAPSGGYLASYPNHGVSDDLITPAATALPLGGFIATAAGLVLVAARGAAPAATRSFIPLAPAPAWSSTSFTIRALTTRPLGSSPASNRSSIISKAISPIRSRSRSMSVTARLWGSRWGRVRSAKASPISTRCPTRNYGTRLSPMPTPSAIAPPRQVCRRRARSMDNGGCRPPKLKLWD